MAKPENSEDPMIKVARITGRWQILTAMIGLGSGVGIALMSGDAWRTKTSNAAQCPIIEIAGQYGADNEWEFEMDLLIGQFESEQQTGTGRIDGNVVANCTTDRVSARIEGRRMVEGSPVLCLFDGTRTGTEGRAVAGRFLCDDHQPAENARSLWRGDARLSSDV